MGKPSQRQEKISKIRKSESIPFLNFYIFQDGKIKRLSESDARYGYYVDRYSPRSLLAFFTVFLLSILDGQFTLNLISKGVSELNPLMNILIHNISAYLPAHTNPCQYAAVLILLQFGRFTCSMLFFHSSLITR